MKSWKRPPSEGVNGNIVLCESVGSVLKIPAANEPQQVCGMRGDGKDSGYKYRFKFFFLEAGPAGKHLRQFPSINKCKLNESLISKT